MMEAQVNIPIPQKLYEQANVIAQSEQRSPQDIIVKFLEYRYSLFNNGSAEFISSEEELPEFVIANDAKIQDKQDMPLNPKPNISRDEQRFLTAHDKDSKRERDAYIKIHPTLLKEYFGEHVAIYNGELVDHDTDYSALFKRVDEKYPDEFVLMRPVEEKPEREFHFRSIRFVEPS
ncbi:MAG: DUF5678 domain-containing protein [Chloroflexota bacterium]